MMLFYVHIHSFYPLTISNVTKLHFSSKKKNIYIIQDISSFLQDVVVSLIYPTILTFGVLNLNNIVKSKIS